MHRLSPAISDDSETEYRAIEMALLESARGRWFLAEHGRRARRLDSALLEDAIGRLQTSLRQPPALLGQLKSEIETLKLHLSQTRAALLAKSETSAGSPMSPPQAMLKAAEDIHDIAWSLQANPFDPKGCEEIARNAGRLYGLGLTRVPNIPPDRNWPEAGAIQSQAIESERSLKTAQAIDAAAHRLDAMLETVIHELQIDRAGAAE